MPGVLQQARAVALVAALPLRTRCPEACRARAQRLNSHTLRGAARPQADVDDIIDLIQRARRRRLLPFCNILSMPRCLLPSQARPRSLISAFAALACAPIPRRAAHHSVTASDTRSAAALHTRAGDRASCVPCYSCPDECLLACGPQVTTDAEIHDDDDGPRRRGRHAGAA